MAGNKFRTGVKGRYQPDVTNPNVAYELEDIVTTMIGSFTGGMLVSGSHGAGGAAPGSGQLAIPFQSFVDNSQDTSTAFTFVPRAYLNWILLDEACPGSEARREAV